MGILNSLGVGATKTLRGIGGINPATSLFASIVDRTNGVTKGVNAIGRATSSSAAAAKPRAATTNKYTAPNTGGGGGGSVLGASTNRAASGGSAGVSSDVRNRLLGQKSTIFSTANDAAATGGRKLNNSILDFVDSLKTGQQGVDNKAIQNELARKQAQSDILGMINKGVNSGASILRNANATSSSATQALADAYAQQGRQQLSQAGQQYELGNREVGQAQEALDMQRNSGVRNIQASKQDIVDGIVQSANEGLASLDAQLIDASLPDRIAIDQEKQAIRNQVLQQLAQYDQLLNERVGGVRALDSDQRRAQASQLANSGVAAEDSFDYETEAPAEFQGTGPFASDLPLFTYRRRQNQG